MGSDCGMTMDKSSNWNAKSEGPSLLNVGGHEDDRLRVVGSPGASMSISTVRTRQFVVASHS